MYLSFPPQEATTGLGAVCVVPPTVATPKLRCDTEDLAAMAVAVGQVVTRTEARDAIKAASQLAVKWLLRAADALKHPRSRAAAGEPMRLKFREAFGTSPEFVPTWRPRGETWDRGNVVRARLLCAAKILANGSIEYVCWGPRSCPFTIESDWRASTWAIVRRGHYRICLGQRFWSAWTDGHKNDLASTLLHESLHIYFPTVTHTEERGTYGQAECYERFVLLINGVPLPDYVKRNCISGIPAGDFPLPRRDRAYA